MCKIMKHISRGVQKYDADVKAGKTSPNNDQHELA
jgi:hypothetical protein